MVNCSFRYHNPVIGSESFSEPYQQRFQLPGGRFGNPDPDKPSRKCGVTVFNMKLELFFCRGTDQCDFAFCYEGLEIVSQVEAGLNLLLEIK